MTFETDALSMLRGFPGVGSVSVSGPRGPFEAIFDNEYVLAGEVDESAPVLHARTSDVAGLVKGAPLTVDGTVYRLRRAEPDGMGMTRLVLESP